MSPTFSNPKPSPDVLWQRLEDEIVLVHLKTDRFFSLDQAAARLWEMMAEGLDLDSIREQLTDEYDVNQAQLEAELSSILSSMKDEQLIVF